MDGPNVGHVREWQYLDGSSMNTSNGLWGQEASINDEQRVLLGIDVKLVQTRCDTTEKYFICER